LLKINK
jgi:hypothetical protein